MKYFTAELYAALQSPDAAAMDAADAHWAQTEQAYESNLSSIRSRLPKTALKLLDDIRLHDAEVLWIGQTGPYFGILVKLDNPNDTTRLLAYRATGKVLLVRDTLPDDVRSSMMQWLYDEVDLGRTPNCFTHSVLFSDGTEVEIEADEVQITTVDTLYAPTLAHHASA